MLKQLDIAEQTYWRWRKAYGSLSPDEARRLRELESGNRRLKTLVADKELELDVLKEIARGTSEPGPSSRLRNDSRASIMFLTTVVLLSGFLLISLRMTQRSSRSTTVRPSFVHHFGGH